MGGLGLIPAMQLFLRSYLTRMDTCHTDRCYLHRTTSTARVHPRRRPYQLPTTTCHRLTISSWRGAIVHQKKHAQYIVDCGVWVLLVLQKSGAELSHQQHKGNKMTTFTYTKAKVNGVQGWIAERRIAGVFSGRMFGKTKKLARESFEASTT